LETAALELVVGQEVSDAGQGLEELDHPAPVELAEDGLEEGWHGVQPVTGELVRVEVQMVLPDPVVRLRKLGLEPLGYLWAEEPVDHDVGERVGRGVGGSSGREDLPEPLDVDARPRFGLRILGHAAVYPREVHAAWVS